MDDEGYSGLSHGDYIHLRHHDISNVQAGSGQTHLDAEKVLGTTPHRAPHPRTSHPPPAHLPHPRTSHSAQ